MCNNNELLLQGELKILLSSRTREIGEGPIARQGESRTIFGLQTR